MIENFLQLYNEELHLLRKQGEAFANAHPKIAGQLRLGHGHEEDPLVGRLLESFAFLTAHLRHKQDEGIKAITNNILNMLYPHYLLPMPCCSTIQFLPKNQLDKSLIIPAKTVIETDVDGFEPCYFTTCYPVKLWPVELSSAHYSRNMLIKPKQYPGKELKSCLCLKIKTLDNDRAIADLDLDKLRFFINAESCMANLIYQLLMKHAKEIIINTNNVPVNIIAPVGFCDQEALLPYPAHSFRGFGLVSEFFGFPEKFFYFDLKEIKKYIHAGSGDELAIYFYFDEIFAELEKLISKDNFVLGCTPLVNIFATKGVPIIIDQQQTDYHVVADAHRSWEGIEIYTIKEITINSAQHDKELTCSPYFGKKFVTQDEECCLYWHACKKSCWELDNYYLPGYETFLSFRNINNFQDLAENIVITPELLCTNRTLPIQLPCGDDKLKLRFWHTNYELVESMRCVTAITSPRYRNKTNNASSDLASHLFLNQICFTSGADTLRILQDSLTLYHYNNEYDDVLVHKGLLVAETKVVAERHPETLKQGFCKGIELTLTVDESYFPESNIYLFGCVLHEYLARSCSVNSFVRLIIKNNHNRELHRWKAKLGIKPIL